MPLASPSKLEKLQIQAFSDRERSSRVGRFEAMFNPESISLSYTIHYAELQSPGSGGEQANFVHGKQAVSPLKIILDGTGVADTGSARSQAESVTDKIERFLDLCVRINGSSHEPNFLRLQWGQGVLQQFDCRLHSLSINYTLFDRSGAPLRAELDVRFSEDVPNDTRARKENRSSPDVSHVRLVRVGDTLPLLCQEIYGSPQPYLLVARANRLDNVRALRPGQKIVFPPLS